MNANCARRKSEKWSNCWRGGRNKNYGWSHGGDFVGVNSNFWLVVFFYFVLFFFFCFANSKPKVQAGCARVPLLSKYLHMGNHNIESTAICVFRLNVAVIFNRSKGGANYHWHWKCKRQYVRNPHKWSDLLRKLWLQQVVGTRVPDSEAVDLLRYWSDAENLDSVL